MVGLDIDGGHDLESVAPDHFAQWEERQLRPAATRRAYRERVAVAARSVIDAVLLRWTGVDWVLASTPRGYRMIAVLDLPISASAARELAEQIHAEIGAPARVEPIPRLEAGRARTTRLPCTGSSRLVDPRGDLVRPMHRRRIEDQGAVIHVRRASPADFGAMVARPKPPPREAQSIRSMERRRSMEAASGQLAGRAFTDECVRHYDEGIGRGESWSALRRWSFLTRVGFGLERRACERVWTALFEREKNNANHAATHRGRRQRLEQFSACVRRYGKAIEHGALQPGRCRDARLHAIVAELLGEPQLSDPPRTRRGRELPPEQSYVSRAAQRRRAASERRASDAAAV